jgi:hypothetical protein
MTSVGASSKHAKGNFSEFIILFAKSLSEISCHDKKISPIIPSIYNGNVSAEKQKQLTFHERRGLICKASGQLFSNYTNGRIMVIAI